MKLAFARLHLNNSRAKDVLEWYRQKLGMAVLREMAVAGDEKVYWVGFEGKAESGFVELRTGPEGRKEYTPRPESDTYWKIGLAIPDVDTARSRLMDNGVSVTEPTQFRDIGYLCHLRDPVDYSIELLQHDFKQNFSPENVAASMDAQLPLGQHVHTGQITLRISNLDESLRFYQDLLGMTLLSRQSIPDKFDLYFLGCTDEEPPVKDINAVEIREWLWKRPYTTLELQYYPNRENASYRTADPEKKNGFSAMGFFVSAERFDVLQKSPSTRDASEKYPEYNSKVLELEDPTGTTIILLQQ